MNRTRLIRPAAVVCALGLSIAACGGSSGPDDATAPEPTDAPAETSASEPDAEPAEVVTPDAATGEVPEIMQFAAPLVGGGEIDAAALADKPTVFWFWAPT